jgi:hypothetical protein
MGQRVPRRCQGTWALFRALPGGRGGGEGRRGSGAARSIQGGGLDPATAAGWLATLGEHGVALEEGGGDRATAGGRPGQAGRARSVDDGRSHRPRSAARGAGPRHPTVEQAEADVVPNSGGRSSSRSRRLTPRRGRVHRLATDLAVAQARCATLRGVLTVQEAEQDAQELPRPSRLGSTGWRRARRTAGGRRRARCAAPGTRRDRSPGP